MKLSLVSIGITSLLLAVSAVAQLVSDEVPHERTLPRSEEIHRQLAVSRQLGPLFIQPLLGFRNLGYDTNVFGTNSSQATGDWRATLFGGAKLLLPLGQKMYLTGNATPEYDYFLRLKDQRNFGGRYGASVLGLFNRLSFEAGGTTDKTLTVVNSELERSAFGRRNDGFARAEVEVFPRLGVFGSGEEVQQRYRIAASDLQNGVDLRQLERNDVAIRGGVRYRFRSYFDVSLAGETGYTDFLTARRENNNTRAVLLGVHYDRPRFYLNLTGGRRTGDPRGTFSVFPHYSTTTGSYYANYRLGAPISVDWYGHRSVAYGLYVANPYYFETRNGMGITFPVAQRVGLRLFGEAGPNSYPIPARGIRRKDNAITYGGGVVYRVYRSLYVVSTASYSRYSSNIPDFSRSFLRVATVVTVRGDLNP